MFLIILLLFVGGTQGMPFLSFFVKLHISHGSGMKCRKMYFQMFQQIKFSNIPENSRDDVNDEIRFY